MSFWYLNRLNLRVIANRPLLGHYSLQNQIQNKFILANCVVEVHIEKREFLDAVVLEDVFGELFVLGADLEGNQKPHEVVQVFVVLQVVQVALCRDHYIC